MLDFVQSITRNDIYNIIVPIGSIVLGALSQHIVGCVNREKQWKIIKEKSSKDKVWEYFLFTMLLGVFVILVYAFAIFLFDYLIKVKLSTEIIKISYFLWFVLAYGYLLIMPQKKENMIIFTRNFKNKKLAIWIIYKIPIIASFLFWGSLLSNQVNFILKIDTIIIVVFEIFFLIVLESDRRINYTEAKFYFYNGTIIENIEVESIYQKKDWIIAKSKKSNTEYRFRIKDIERIEYRE